MDVVSGVEVETYRRQVEQWRSAREESLRAPEGWLSLAGLHVLEDGEYSLGSGEDNRIQLPASAPVLVGTLAYRAGSALLDVMTDAPVLVEGVPMWRVEMVDNEQGRAPTVVKLGNISMNLHRFGDEVALRVRDRTHPAIQEFGGCAWYAIDPAYRVMGKLLREASPTDITVATSVKTSASYHSVGAIAFELLGQAFTLLAAATVKPTELMIIFRDATAGKTTYGAGRYLYVPVDEAGNVLLDFNRAYSPPCAYTPFATCSLPPAANILPIAVKAGELDPHL